MKAAPSCRRRKGWLACVLGLAAVLAGWGVLQKFPRVGTLRAAHFQTLEKEWVLIPESRLRLGSPEGAPDALPRRAHVAAFWMGRCEVTVADYAGFLNATAFSTQHPQCVRRGDRLVPRRGAARQPVAWVSRADAEAYCLWRSEREDACIRLPTESEWETAARGGLYGARYPWGWGSPEGRASFRSARPRRVGRHAPNAFGLYDMAGNVFEWCMADVEAPAPADSAPARGGSWAERDARMLLVFRRAFFPLDYRDADVGFRMVQDATVDEVQDATSR